MSEMRARCGVLWGGDRLYSNGVAIRVMLEYIDYWGDQRVGDDGMTPLLNSREDEGSKQPVLYTLLLGLSSLSTPSPSLSPLFPPVAFAFGKPPRLSITSSADFHCFISAPSRRKDPRRKVVLLSNIFNLTKKNYRS